MASDGSRPGPACESCGDVGRSLRPVHRVYLEDGADGALRVASRQPQMEWWCPSCVAQYPNEPGG